MHLITFIGCRSSSVNLEARSLTGWSTNRHCVIARLQDIKSHHLREIRSKAGALFIVLPKDIGQLSKELQQVLVLDEGDFFFKRNYSKKLFLFSK